MPTPSTTNWGSLNPSNPQPSDILALSGVQLTKLAKKFEDLGNEDPLAQLFPEERMAERHIVIERPIIGLGIAPIVNPGQPDALYQGPKVERMQVSPAYVRESDFLPEHLINDIRAIGTLNDRHPAMELVAQRIQIMMDRNNRLFQVLRAMTLLGGINYTDPRTQVSMNVNTGIPAANLFGVGTGFAKQWGDATAEFVMELRLLKRRQHNLNKVVPDTLIMSSDLKTVIEQNEFIKKELSSEGAGNVRGFVQWQNGELVAIAGMKIQTVDFIYEDPTQQGKKIKLWPINKVAMLTSKHQGLPLGYTQYCVGEGPGGPIGLWSRSGPDNPPPAAPGRTIQIGNSGLPYCVYPDWINILTVGTVNQLETAAGGVVTV